MSFRYRDEDSLGTTIFSVAAGALAGFVVGVVLAQRVGGLAGITERVRRRGGRIASSVRRRFEEEEEQFDDELDDEEDEDDGEAELEERVLEAFRNDPMLGERAIDIGAISPGVIELAGWVQTEDEAEHAVTVAGGTPGVDTVVNRLLVGEEEQLLDENVRRAEESDPAFSEGHWEGQQIGTGRRRQGTSAEPDRHADPRVPLEDRWLSEQEAVRNAADAEPVAEQRRRKTKRAARGDRTGGSPTAPTGVPKADHVQKAERIDPETRAD
ncbi:MAG TPA: BON domain-containing protein [Gemmatimonadaceae bacterium]|nr:BON domain-containing protein [Gemmatimonadaceae bacterium]